MEKIRANIEADGGEAARQQRLETERLLLREAAAAKAMAIDQHAMEAAVGKGDGKGDGGKMFSTRVSPATYSPYAGKSDMERVALSNILSASISLAAF